MALAVAGWPDGRTGDLVLGRAGKLALGRALGRTLGRGSVWPGLMWARVCLAVLNAACISGPPGRYASLFHATCGQLVLTDTRPMVARRYLIYFEKA